MAWQGCSKSETDLAAREVHRAAAELQDTDLERHAGAQRRLLEDQRQRAAGQRRAAAAFLPPLLEVGRQLEQVEHALAREVRAADEVPHALALASTALRMSTARRISDESTISGGTRRTTFSPALSTSSPCSRQASSTGAAAVVSSMPINSPRPR